MTICLDERDLKQGLLGLVVALAEIIRDALRLQAVKRMEGGVLGADECERLGQALMDLDAALEQIKAEQGITEAVWTVRDGLDGIVADLVDRLAAPQHRQDGVEVRF